MTRSHRLPADRANLSRPNPPDRLQITITDTLLSFFRVTKKNRLLYSTVYVVYSIYREEFFLINFFSNLRVRIVTVIVICNRYIFAKHNR